MSAPDEGLRTMQDFYAMVAAFAQRQSREAQHLTETHRERDEAIERLLDENLNLEGALRGMVRQAEEFYGPEPEGDFDEIRYARSLLKIQVSS